jgi:hypothetical protein
VQKVEVVKEGTSIFPNESPSLITPISYGPSELNAQSVLGG